MTPPTDNDWLLYLDAAALAAQKLHKRVRRWRNQGHASDQDVADAAAALAAIRAIYARHGLAAVDLDSGAERTYSMNAGTPVSCNPLALNIRRSLEIYLSSLT